MLSGKHQGRFHVPQYRRDSSAKALVAARTEREHQDYLNGKESGVYGQFSPKGCESIECPDISGPVVMSGVLLLDSVECRAYRAIAG